MDGRTERGSSPALGATDVIVQRAIKRSSIFRQYLRIHWTSCCFWMEGPRLTWKCMRRTPSRRHAGHRVVRRYSTSTSTSTCRLLLLVRYRTVPLLLPLQPCCYGLLRTRTHITPPHRRTRNDLRLLFVLIFPHRRISSLFSYEYSTCTRRLLLLVRFRTVPLLLPLLLLRTRTSTHTPPHRTRNDSRLLFVLFSHRRLSATRRIRVGHNVVELHGYDDVREQASRRRSLRRKNKPIDVSIDHSWDRDDCR